MEGGGMAAGSNFLGIIPTDELERLRSSARDGLRHPVAALAADQVNSQHRTGSSPLKTGILAMCSVGRLWLLRQGLLTTVLIRDDECALMLRWQRPATLVSPRTAVGPIHSCAGHRCVGPSCGTSRLAFGFYAATVPTL